MVTEADSGSHSMIFTLSAAIFCVLRVQGESKKCVHCLIKRNSQNKTRILTK